MKKNPLTQISFIFLNVTDGDKLSTLVLNRLWQAVNVIGVERAFSLLALDHAQVITRRTVALGFLTPCWFGFCKESEFEKGARVVRTVNQPVLVPAVLLLRGFDRMLMRK